MATDTGDRRDSERPYAAFGEAVRSAREREGLSRSDVANRLSISYPMLANIESGRRRLSDELLARLAPLLGVDIEELRLLRDADSPPTSARRHDTGRVANVTPTGEIAGVGTHEADIGAARATIIRLLNQTVHGNTQYTTAGVTLARMLLESQEVNALTSASDPLALLELEGRSGQISALLRDLRELDNASIDKVHAFVKGLLAAQMREATALDPMANVPLVRVPSEPFGPGREWAAPAWMRDLPDIEQARHRARRLRDRSGAFERHLERGFTLGRRIAEHFHRGLTARAVLSERDIPPIEALAIAVDIGMALRPPGRNKLGFVDAYAWLEFIEYYPNLLHGPEAWTTLSRWLARMVFIGAVTRGPGSTEITSFIDDCMEFSADLAPRWLATDQRQAARGVGADRRDR